MRPQTTLIGGASALVLTLLLSGCSPDKSAVADGPASSEPVASVSEVPEPQGIDKIDHLVFIVMENRSFDHYFGTDPGADGIPSKVCVPDPYLDGDCQQPFHDRETMNEGGPHTKRASDIDVNGGKMDGFIEAAYRTPGSSCAKGREAGNCLEHVGPNLQPDILGYHTRDEIPVYWDLADRGVLQDRMFAPTDSWTLPAHLYLISAWSAFCDQKDDPMSCHTSVGSDESLAKPTGKDTPYAWTDITHLLEEAGVSWGYYISPKGTCYESECGRPRNADQTSGFQNVLPDFTTTKENGTSDKITSYTLFTDLAKQGKLPSVSWVMPALNESEHPVHSDIIQGQRWVTRMVNAVTEGPSWDDTAIFITWDDWGGFYDHVPPPKIDAGGYGMRVPGLMISPYAKVGEIDHQILSFDAYLKLIEERFLDGAALDPDTMSRPDSRKTVREYEPRLGNLAKEFDFEQAPGKPVVLEAP